MANNEEEQHRDNLLCIHRRNARRIEQQIAQYGIEPPIHLYNALDHECRKIAELETKREGENQKEEFRDSSTLEHDSDHSVNQGIHEKVVSQSVDMQPLRSSLVRPRPAPLTRSTPRFRQIAWRTKMNALRWWQTGGITFALVVILVVTQLWHPAPDPALVDQLRADAAPTLVATLMIGEHTIEPAQIQARTGAIVALTITNDSTKLQRWVLFDGALPAGRQQLVSGLRDPSLVRRETALLKTGESFTLTFVPPHAGSYSFTSISQDGTVGTWGVIEVRDAAK